MTVGRPGHHPGRRHRGHSVQGGDDRWAGHAGVGVGGWPGAGLGVIDSDIWAGCTLVGLRSHGRRGRACVLLVSN